MPSGTSCFSVGSGWPELRHPGGVRDPRGPDRGAAGGSRFDCGERLPPLPAVPRLRGVVAAIASPPQPRWRGRRPSVTPARRPLQNRVDPFGHLHAVAARGAWMGNRGVLHDAQKRIVVEHRLERWITCVLTFRGRHREVMAPGRYTELFFLDEATSLAAGHRPCAECRRSRYEEFRAAWARAGAGGSGADPESPLPRAGAMDAVLHAERLRPDGGRRTYEAPLSSLPDGAMIERDGRPHLWKRGALAPWSFTGYGVPVLASPAARVPVLTPRSIVSAIAAGFEPQLHESAKGA